MGELKDMAVQQDLSLPNISHEGTNTSCLGPCLATTVKFKLIFFSLLGGHEKKNQRVALLGPWPRQLIGKTFSCLCVPSNGGWQEMKSLRSELPLTDRERLGDSQQHSKDREKGRGQQEMAWMPWVMTEDGCFSVKTGSPKKIWFNPTEMK